MTSHSPEMLDNKEIAADSIFAVVVHQGESRIAPLDDTGRAALQKHLYTAGQLLRMGQLVPDPALANPSPKQIDLFGANS